MEPLRVGVIGFGKMGLLHASLAHGLPISRLAAAADPTAGALETLNRLQPELAVYDDYTSMLDKEHLDAVFIASPTHLHAEMALACVSAGIPFLVEKPLSARAADCESLVDALARKPIVNAVGFMARHLDTFRKAKSIVDGGALGRLVHLQATMYVTQLFREGQGWRYDPRHSGGGVLITQNSHLIDLLLWLFGPMVRVQGHVKRFYSPNVEDFAHAVFEFKSGLSGYMDASWSVRHHRTVELSVTVHAENGTLEVNDDGVKLFLDDATAGYSAGWTVFRKPDLFEGVALDVGGPEYTRQDEQFLAAVAAKRGVDSDVHSALRVQRVVEAIYAASASGRSVSLE
jgi:predicted dehydrogenase